ncbi:MAG: hypothetical protein AB1898_11950 [Acidobacteriota bacterium]
MKDANLRSFLWSNANLLDAIRRWRLRTGPNWMGLCSAQFRRAVLVLTGVACWLLCAGCSTRPPSSESDLFSEISYSAFEEGEIWFRNSGIQIRFDSEMYCRIFLRRDGKLLSMNDIPPDESRAKPPFYLSIGNVEVLNFRVDYRNVGTVDFRTQLGFGKRLHLRGYAKTAGGAILEKRVAVELYQDHPTIAVVSVSYRNVDKDRTAVVSTATNSFFRLDAKRLDSAVRSFQFRLFQEFDGGRPQSIEIRQPNFKSRYSSPSGVEFHPALDLWTPVMGMLFADISEHCPVQSVALEVSSDERLEVWMESDCVGVLQPNQTSPVIRSLWMVHPGEHDVAWKEFTSLSAILNSGLHSVNHGTLLSDIQQVTDEAAALTLSQLSFGH